MAVFPVFFIFLFWTGFAEEIVTFPKNVTAVAGDMVEFPCEVKFSTSVSSLAWEFNDEAVYHNQYDQEEYTNATKIARQFLVKQEGTNFKLTLKEAFYEAAGKYTCRLTRAVAEVYLFVIDTPQLTASVTKQEEQKMAVYICEARFAGPSKTVVEPDQYPQLRMLFDDILMEEPVCEVQPKNSTSYRVLKQVYRIYIHPGMDGKRLNCMIMTSSPKIVASTHIEVNTHEEKHADTANNSGNLGVIFSVINLILLLTVISCSGFIIYKLVLCPKKTNDYEALQTHDPMDKQVEPEEAISNQPEGSDAQDQPSTSGEHQQTPEASLENERHCEDQDNATQKQSDKARKIPVISKWKNKMLRPKPNDDKKGGKDAKAEHDIEMKDEEQGEAADENIATESNSGNDQGSSKDKKGKRKRKSNDKKSCI